MPPLINLTDAHIKNINYYWHRRDMYDLTEAELIEAGVHDGNAYVCQEIIPALHKANEILQAQGFELLVKEGYRSPELYLLVKRKRYAKFGKADTDKTLDPITMPHAKGKTVDVTLGQLRDGEEMELRDKADWPDAAFINYYRDKQDSRSQEYQRLQDILVQTMQSVGFELGGKQEYWHFSFVG
jgi:D-alanyl-D-alanine dipeptidase